MMVTGVWARLLLFGLVVALVGLLGVTLASAQEGSETAEEAVAEAAGDDSDAADELLAKALDFARSIQAGDVAQPPVRVESRQLSVLAEDAGLTSGLELPPLDLRYLTLVDSKGNSQAEFVDAQYLGDDLMRVPEEQRAYLTLRSQRPEYLLVDGIFYNSTDLIAHRDIHFQYFGEFGEEFSLYTPWVSRVLSDVVDTQSDSGTKVLNYFFERADDLTAFPGTIGDAQYTANLLENAISASSVGQSNIRGHDTTELRVSITVADVLWANFRDIRDAEVSSRLLGFNLVRPSQDLISEIFASDNVVEFRIWIDESGKIHRLITDYSKAFSAYFEFAFAGIVDLGSGGLDHATTSEFFYLDEDPVIVAPDADDVLAIESISSYAEYILAPVREDTADSEGSVAERPAVDTGDDLADTGLNSSLLAIVGVSVALAGVMVLGLGRRLRTPRVR